LQPHHRKEMKIDRINYNRIAQAQAFYKGRGYQNVEAPWLVMPQAVRATLPLGKTLMETVRGVMVNSGEQAFIQLIMDGKMEPGTYQTTTPCFQDAADHHSPYYFGADENNPWSQQVELIWYQPDDVRASYERVVNDVMSCFFEISDAEAFDAMQNEEGVDLRFNGIVVGSYGVRKMNEHLWVYGTGLIEPRFTIALHSVFGATTETHTHEAPPPAEAAPVEEPIESKVLRFPEPSAEVKDATV
jgi:hypothetical protein